MNILISKLPTEQSFSIDLHGKTVPEAEKILSYWFTKAHEDKISKITIITGKGNHSKNGYGKLFNETVPHFLERPEIKDHILDYKKDMGAYEVTFKKERPGFEEINKIKKITAPFIFPQENLAEVKKRAENGSAEDQFYLAGRYADGFGGVSKDAQQESYWMHKAAENGHKHAQNILGCWYDVGYNVEHNYKEAHKWHVKAASGDNPEAHSLFTLGRYYWQGVGVIRNDKKAVDYFTKAALLKEPHAAYNLGKIYLEGEESIEPDGILANKFLTISSENGFLLAQLLLAKQYFFGWRLKQDYGQALKWFTAAKKDVIAQYYLGKIYTEGLGVPVDLKKGYEYFEISAKNGDKDARSSIAVAMIKGIYYPQNIKKGLAELDALVNEGHGNSAATLGLCYLHGVPNKLETDSNKGLTYLSKGAAMGSLNCQKELANIYLSSSADNKGIKAEGERLLRLAANQNDIEALLNLANHLENTNRNNSKEVIKCYEKAIALGSSKAKCLLGLTYLEKKEIEKAKKLFTEAANDGELAARHELGRLLIASDSKDDHKFAVSHFAASTQYPPSLTALAVCYFNGRGVNQDLEKGHLYLTQAAEKGDRYAQNIILKQQKKFQSDLEAAKNGDSEMIMNVAKYYLLNHNFSEAASWAKKSAIKGHADAEYLLGVIYSHVSYKDANLDKALYWLEKALSHNHSGSVSLLSHFYNKKTNVAKPALKLLREAAINGNKPAIGFMLQVSIKDSSLATDDWIKAATAKNDLQLKFLIAQLYRYHNKLDEAEKMLIEILDSDDNNTHTAQLKMKCIATLGSLEFAQNESSDTKELNARQIKNQPEDKPDPYWNFISFQDFYKF